MKRYVLLGLLSILIALSPARHGAYAQQCLPSYLETQKIEGMTSSYSSQFGHAVAIDGDVMAIARPNANYFQSHVSVYERQDNTWVWVQDLIPPDTNINTYSSFGFSVAVSGATIVVGDPLYANREGIVWVFTKRGTRWERDVNSTLQPSSPQEKSDFGYAVAMSGDRILVGAPRYVNVLKARGMAFLYTRSRNTWQEAQLGPASVDTGDFRYGHSVAIDGDLAVIGAPDDINTQGAADAGRVTIWEDLSGWRLTKRLQPADVLGGDQLGYAVAVQGHTVMLGAPYHQTPYVGGAVYQYERDPSEADVYHHRAKMVPDYNCTGGYTWGFGFSLDLDGNDLLIGAPSSGMDEEGEAWLYKEQQGRWVASQVYHQSNPGRKDNMGYAVAISKGVAVVGAPFHGSRRGGAAFVYDQKQLGSNKHAGDASVEEEAPERFVLAPNYPNPFNPTTRIRYTLAEAAPVRLEVFDLTGQLVATLADEVQAQGVHEVSFDAGQLSSGTYLYRLSAGAYRETRIMVLLR